MEAIFQQKSPCSANYPVYNISDLYYTRSQRCLTGHYPRISSTGTTAGRSAWRRSQRPPDRPTYTPSQPPFQRDTLPGTSLLTGSDIQSSQLKYSGSHLTQFVHAFTLPQESQAYNFETIQFRRVADLSVSAAPQIQYSNISRFPEELCSILVALVVFGAWVCRLDQYHPMILIPKY